MRTKNRPVLLRRAIESVINQTFSDWCLTIVNDGGPADEVDVAIEQFPDRKNKIRVIHNPTSLGMEAASNQALAQASGAFFAIHDDDDTWNPEFLSETTSFLNREENGPAIGVATGSEIIWEHISGQMILEENRKLMDSSVKDTSFASLLTKNRWPPISLLFRSCLISEIGSYNPNLPVLGDWEFNIRALIAGEIGFLPKTLAFWHRRRDDSSPYGNTVEAGHAIHAHYDHIIRNQIVRSALSEHPELSGVLQLLLHELNQSEVRIKNLIETQTAIITSYLGQIGEFDGCEKQQSTTGTCSVAALDIIDGASDRRHSTITRAYKSLMRWGRRTSLGR